MQKMYVRCCAVFALLAFGRLSATSQATKLTNMSYGAFSIGSNASTPTTIQNVYLYNNSFYFIGRSATNVLEWQKLDLTSNTMTQVTSNHFQDPTSYVIFRDPVRFGDNVFVSSAAPNNLQDLEFSRFNLAAATEQRVDIATGYYSTSPTVVANSSDPIQYVKATNGRVYFKPTTPSTGNQIWYWDPNTQNVTQLTSFNGSTGMSQNTGTGMVVLGDTLYTSYSPSSSSSATNFLRVNINNGNVSTIATAPYYITQLTVMNGKIYFGGRASNTLTGASNPYNLYVYNPATGSSTQLTNYPTVAPTTNGSTAVSNLFVGNDGKTLFVNIGITTNTSANGDFISVNTQTDVVTTRNIAVSSAAAPDRCYYLHSVGNNVYVVRRITNTSTSTSTYGIYKINLTTNIATLISANNFTSISSNNTYATTNVLDPINGRIYLQAAEATYGSEVYELNLFTDAFTRLTDINTSGDSNPTAFGFYNNNLYFLASAAGTSSPDYEFYSLPVAVILPLKWESFTAMAAATGGVLLNWKVAEQQGVKNFVVETSANGNSWEAIATVAATGSNSYQYPDKMRDGKVVYYRIKELSADGNHTYSEVRKVALTANNISFILLSNPSKSGLITMAFSATATHAPVSIVDASGKVIARRQWNGGAGNLKISVPAAGVYHVLFDNQTLRAVVQE